MGHIKFAPAPAPTAGAARAATRGRHRPLGAFRLALALLVAVQHYQYLLPLPSRLVFNRLGLGIVAVAAFFLVSGFVVTEVSATVYRGRPAAFLLNRLLRLVPPYMAALAVSVLVHALLWRAGALRLWDWDLTSDPVTWRHVATSLAALVPGIRNDFEFLPFSWSLRVEVGFYLVIFVTMLVASRRRHGTAPGWACVAFLLAAVAAAYWRGGPAMMFDAPAFLAGVAVWRFATAPTPMRAAALAASLAVAAAAFTLWPQRFTPWVGSQLAILGGIVCLLLWLLLSARLGAAARRVDTALGALSYPLYLNHYIVGILFTDLMPAKGPWVVSAALTTAIALALVMHRLVEVPLERLRRRIRYSTASMAPSGPRASMRALTSAKPV